MSKAAVLTIGDEILIGQIIDTNSSWIGQQLTDHGIEVVERHSVGDDQSAIERVFDHVLDRVDLVICTGGLGPTQDDRTKLAICSYFDTELEFNEENYAWMESLFAKWGREPRESHRTQAFLPKAAEVLKNSMGTAPGLMLQKGRTRFVFTPGVPYEMKDIVSEQLIPRLAQWYDLPPIIHRTLLTSGMGETDIEAKIQDIESALPDNMSLAYLPGKGRVRLRVMMKGKESSTTLLETWTHKIFDRLGPELVYGQGEEEMVEVIGRILKEQGRSLTLAESCTGGYVAHQITQMPGSSAFFRGSVVSYSNDLKVSELGVRPETLELHGAVSKEVVEQMAEGALRRYRADVALSVSGIAGPSGGSEEKPVGTVWMAVSDGKKTIARKYRFGKSRALNITYTGMYGLNMIRKFLLGLEIR